MIMRTPWSSRLTPHYPMPLGDRLDGVLLSTDPWHGTIIPATSPLRATAGLTSASWFQSCNPSDRLLKIQQSFVKHRALIRADGETLAHRTLHSQVFCAPKDHADEDDTYGLHTC